MRVPVRLAVLGDPLTFTLSPALHRAGLEALGLPGTSGALRVPQERLGATLGGLADAGYRGVNVTRPLKQAALACLAGATEEARRAGSVNTVSFEPGGAQGDTTDGVGFVALLEELGVPCAGARVVLLGTGAAARSLALALLTAGSAVVAWARRPAHASPDWAPIAGARLVAWGCPAGVAALEAADVVVNATPLSGPAGPLAIGDLPRRARVVDLVYGSEVTPWVRAARAGGLEAVDGLGLLVHQARRSLALWTGREVPLAPLARAVGWPR